MTGQFCPTRDLAFANFPKCPSLLTSLTLLDSPDLTVMLSGSLVGSWWPLSSSAARISLSVPVEGFESNVIFLTYLSADRWRDTVSGQIFNWRSITAPKKRQRPSESVPYFRTPTRGATRSCILPLSPLDTQHRALLDALALRVCVHQDVGRVLVTSRSFEQGETVICSSVPSRIVESDDDISRFVPETDLPGSFIIVPRLSRVFYNPQFNGSDPLCSGDAWYLVNHSDTPNCELKAEVKGSSRLVVRAKRALGENEPLTWCYNSEFFSSDEKIDLPSRIIPDLGTVWSAKTERVLKPQNSLCLSD